MSSTKPSAFILARIVEPNRGDMMSRYGVLRALRRALPGAQLFAVSTRPVTELPEGSHTIAPGGLKNLFPTADERMLFASHDCTVLWTCGHDYTDDGSPFKSIHAALRAVICRAYGVPFWVVAQGAGPVRHRITKWAICLLGFAATRLFIRDPESLALMKSFIRPEDHAKLSLTADSALLSIPEQTLEQAELLPESPTLGINVRQWFHLNHGILPKFIQSRLPSFDPKAQLDARMEQLLDNFAKLADHAIEAHGVSVKFVPMYPPNSENWELDEYCSSLIIQRMKHPERASILDKDIGPEDLVGLFRSLSAMVGVRLHSTIIATGCGVPAVHIAYSPKGWSYFKMLGQDQYVLDINKVATEAGLAMMTDAFDSLWANQRECRKLLHENGAALRNLALAPIEALVTTNAPEGKPRG